MALLKEAERICQELKYKIGLATILESKALILRATGDLDGSMALLKEAERICRELGDQDGLLASLSTQADIFAFDQNNFPAALPLIEEAYQIAESCGFEILKQTLLPDLEKIRQKVQE